jgi:hypothetical protein
MQQQQGSEQTDKRSSSSPTIRTDKHQRAVEQWNAHNFAEFDEIFDKRTIFGKQLAPSLPLFAAVLISANGPTLQIGSCLFCSLLFH